ncbi:MAG: response regulator [Candidatus Ozemobacteraceae bacterium]
MTAARILIIDDTKNIRMTLEMALSSKEWEVEGASTGAEGLALLETGQFHLALLDLNLPEMHGMDVLRAIRKSRPEVDVIIITAFGTIECSVEAMKLGAVDFLSKPFTPDQVRKAVAQVLARPRDPSSAHFPGGTDPLERAKGAIQRGNLDAAEHSLKAAIEAKPSSSEALNLMGLLWESRGNKIEAQKYYRAALSFDPGYASARRNLERVVIR